MIGNHSVAAAASISATRTRISVWTAVEDWTVVVGWTAVEEAAWGEFNTAAMKKRYSKVYLGSQILIDWAQLRIIPAH